MSGLDEIREVFERVGSPIALLEDGAVIQHATHSLTLAGGLCEKVANVWEPRSIETTSGMLRTLADLAEIGELRAAEETPSPCAVCGYAGTCGDPPGEDCHS